MIDPTSDELERLFLAKYGRPSKAGWGPTIRLQHGFHAPDDYYEALVDRLVGTDTRWLDVGCGHRLFPYNPGLSTVLSERCETLVGVDPDPSLLENPFVHQKACVSIDRYQPDCPFDIVTMRMVAEHVEDPNGVADALGRCLDLGGRVVVYTPQRWSLIPMLNRFVPSRLRHWIKKVLWDTEERDTFPALYRMNTRGALRELFAARSCSEVGFWSLDHCGTFGNYRLGLRGELIFRGVLRRLGLPYPVRCLIGVYERTAPMVGGPAASAVEVGIRGDTL